MKTKCLIVDDEPLAIEVIENHLSKFDQFELVGKCNNAFEAINALQSHKVDLLFCDINMPEMKGTDLVKNLKNPPKIIFTTAYREYAMEGYELNVLDYLLKPIPFDRFMKAVNKYNELNQQKTTDISFHASSNAKESFIYVREKHQVHKILSQNILFIESLGDYIKIITPSQKLNIRSTISSLEQMLSGDMFLRIHRSFIINTKYITRFTANAIFIDNKEFPIGPSYKKEVFKILDYGKFIE